MIHSDLLPENRKELLPKDDPAKAEVVFAFSIPDQLNFFRETQIPHISTTSGDIKVKLPKTQDARYDLSTTSGKIDSAHGSNKASSLEVKIHTTSGDIDIE